MSSSVPLDRWLPHLLDLWRSGSGPSDGLSTAEADAVARGVKELSQGLTGERRLAGARYMARGDLLGAYLLYYWPVSFAQTLFALRQGGISRGKRALDLGSGPAPGSMALLEAGWSQVTAIDQSSEALAVARQLASRGGYKLDTASWRSGEKLPGTGSWDLILAGHVFNEIGAGSLEALDERFELLEQLGDRLAPDGKVLILEPAAHGPNAQALGLRDRAAAAGWFIEGPCFFQGACPALATGSACHDVLHWKVPHLVAQTARRAGIDKRTSPFTWLVLSKRKGATVNPQRVRVVSDPLLNKAGRRRVVVCGAAGRFSLSAPGAYRNPVWNQASRGKSLVVKDPEVREGGWGLGPETKLLP